MKYLDVECLPRACGDRPAPLFAVISVVWPPPRMRGSTSISRSTYTLCHASPAHAGIDPRRRYTHCASHRLPRACGDRPFDWSDKSEHELPPPRMRGSTSRLGLTHLGHFASPAHAGIDPLTSPVGWKVRCLPRACGDRPLLAVIFLPPYRPPPRMRGSTPKASYAMR